MAVDAQPSAYQHQHRFIQVLTMCFIGCLVGAAISGPKSRIVLLLSALAMCGIYWLLLATPKKALAISCFLWLTTVLTSALIALNNAIYDPMIICYALILMYAALFSSRRTFFSLLFFICLYCTVLLQAILSGYWHWPAPRVREMSIIAINLFLVITGCSAWFIAKDFKALIRNLRHENQQSKQAQQEIARIATQDPLTGLYNRMHAELEFDKLAQQGRSLSVLFIDLDNFKPINDAYGHAYGDMALNIIATRLRALVADNEICCRFGGDEFVLVLQCSEPSQCHDRYTQILLEMAKEMQLELRTFNISASIGVALYPHHGRDFNELCRLADMAMYRSKSAGRNTIVEYRPQWQDEQRKRSEMIQALRLAAAHQELFLVYQPKFALPNCHINGVEALVRWQSPIFGLVSPATFIPLAEETGVIDEIGLWVLKQACKDCKDWWAQGFDIAVSVNLSPAQLNSGQLSSHVLAILAEVQLPAHLLELEITESMLMQDQQAIDSQISVLTNQGINFAIDDFGTGFSNLHYLSRFKAATLKIDQSFIKNLSKSSQHYHLVKGIIGLAKTLGLTTVAEGVEDDNTLQILASMDCDSVQGYLLSKPLPLSALHRKWHETATHSAQ